MSQIREVVSFTKGQIFVRGKLVTRGKAKRADCILYYKPNIPFALIKAKDNNHSVGDGIQQGLDYATSLNIPFVFSSNGDGFVFHDRTGISPVKETNPALDAFPGHNAVNTLGQLGKHPRVNALRRFINYPLSKNVIHAIKYISFNSAGPLNLNFFCA